jgi:hypothetical protein
VGYILGPLAVPDEAATSPCYEATTSPCSQTNSSVENGVSAGQTLFNCPCQAIEVCESLCHIGGHWAAKDRNPSLLSYWVSVRNLAVPHSCLHVALIKSGILDKRSVRRASSRSLSGKRQTGSGVSEGPKRPERWSPWTRVAPWTSVFFHRFSAGSLRYLLDSCSPAASECSVPARGLPAAALVCRFPASKRWGRGRNQPEIRLMCAH